MTDSGDPVVRVDVEISDPGEFRAMREWLTRVPGVDIEQAPGTPLPGEQGWWDVLSVLAGSSSVLAVAVRSLPDFIRSRRSDVRITLRSAGQEVTLEASNLDDVTGIVARLLHG